jgi:hypothetical protein
MEEGLYTLLAENVTIAPEAIGWFTAPQGIGYPKIVLNVINEAEGLVMNGPNGLLEGIVQIDVYDLDRSRCKDVSRQVRHILHGYKGGGFSLIRHDRTRDTREGGSNEAERPYRVSMDFMTGWSAYNAAT